MASSGGSGVTAHPKSTTSKASSTRDKASIVPQFGDSLSGQATASASKTILQSPKEAIDSKARQLCDCTEELLVEAHIDLSINNYAKQVENGNCQCIIFIVIA